MAGLRNRNNNSDRSERQYMDDEQGIQWFTLSAMGICLLVAIAALVKLIILSISGG